ncbi:MAG TPA: hypothetical protein VMA98_00025 [Candidatus Acidoferrales bacterium]|nr:hypothetical protein [Candidatus Acidoferrales bacterium]
MSIIRPAVSERMIRRNGFVRCPFSAAVGYAQKFLARGRPEELLVAGSLDVLAVEDYTDSARRHDALEFSWHPRSRLFPQGQALLTVRPHAPQGTELQFSLAYIPPLGVPGQLFDHLIGRHIAWITGGMLLRRLRTEIERSAHNA